MKKLQNLTLGILSAATLFAACAKDSDSGAIQSPPLPDEPLPGTTVTINAAVQGDDESLSKVALSQPDNTLDLVAKWQEDDQIQVFAKQGGKTYEVGKVPVENISSDGKTCSFNVVLPGEINTSKAYELYGLCGVEGTFEDGVLTFAAATQRVPFDKFKAPLMFAATASSTTVNAKFEHIGTYEVLHIVNKTSSNFNFAHNGYDVAAPWCYDNFKCTVGYSDSKTTLSVSQQDGGANISEVTVLGGQSAAIVSWYVPNGGKIAGATLNGRINGGEVKTSNVKSSNTEIRRGNAYHLYALWDGSELKFGDQTVTAKVPSLTYRLNTSPMVYAGETVNMKVISDMACAITVLVDGKEIGSVESAKTYDIALPTDNPGEYDVTIKGSAGGFDGLDVNFKFGVRSNLDDVETKTFDILGVPVEFVYVKGGTFMMGGTAEQGADAQSDEFPVHSVTLDGYYISKYEVTRQIYKKVFGRDSLLVADDSKYPQGDMSWNSTNDFINKLRDTTGTDFRLPTEAEWEYAARGGQKSKNYKYSGSNLVGMVAHYNANSAGRVQPIGVKMNNELGIFDMSGNMWEFVSDPYGTYPEDPVYNPQGSGSDHVLRGGGGGASAADCRVSRRADYWYNGYGITSWDFGFRLVIRP